MNTTPEPTSGSPSAPISPPAHSSDAFHVSDSQCMVFLVDDHAMVGEAVRRELATEPDIDFHYCGDFVNAVAHACRVRPTVILQDLVMPGVDGITLVRNYRIHPALHDVPIIVLSTKEDAQVKSAAFEAGANDYLVKLPDRIELIARIRYHSKAHLHRVQRDEAYRALQTSQRQLSQRVQELEAALTHVKKLQGLLPICAWCKNIRNDEGYWQSVEKYVQQNTDVQFSHGLCPECARKYFPGAGKLESRGSANDPEKGQ